MNNDFLVFLLGFLFAAFIVVITTPAKKDWTFESPKPIPAELVIKQVDGKADTTYIYHHPEYFKQR